MYCMICKNRVGTRYTLSVSDSKMKNDIKGYVCRECFNRFIDSYYHRGVFKISKVLGWIKSRDRFRN